MSETQEILRTLTEIRDSLAPDRRWWCRPWIRKLSIFLIGLVLLALLDFRTSPELKAPEGATVTLVALPEPDLRKNFPECDDEALATIRPQLQKFWSLPAEKSPVAVFDVSLVRSGVTYDRTSIRVLPSQGKTIARLGGARALALKGATEIQIRAISPDDSGRNNPLIRTHGLLIAGTTIRLEQIINNRTGSGTFSVITTPPPGLSRLGYNLEKAWALFF